MGRHHPSTMRLQALPPGWLVQGGQEDKLGSPGQEVHALPTGPLWPFSAAAWRGPPLELEGEAPSLTYSSQLSLLPGGCKGAGLSCRGCKGKCYMGSPPPLCAHSSTGLNCERRRPRSRLKTTATCHLLRLLASPWTGTACPTSSLPPPKLTPAARAPIGWSEQPPRRGAGSAHPAPPGLNPSPRAELVRSPHRLLRLSARRLHQQPTAGEGGSRKGIWYRSAGPSVCGQKVYR